MDELGTGGGSPGAVSRESASQLLAETCKAYRRSREKALSTVGLRIGQDLVLRELWREDGQRPAELVERLNVSFPTLTRALDRMRRDGLLARHRDPEDARSFRIHLTEEGHKLREPLENLWREIGERTMRGLSEEERATLHDLLSKVQENLRHNAGEVADTDC